MHRCGSSLLQDYGTPKGIVQGHGGIVVEHLKSVALGSGIRPGNRCLLLLDQLDGLELARRLPARRRDARAVRRQPGHPDVCGNWRVVEAAQVNVFGTGAAYLTGCEKAGAEPGRDFDLSALRGVISTGSPLPLSTWSWVYDHVKSDVRLDSSSGGDRCLRRAHLRVAMAAGLPRGAVGALPGRPGAGL